MKKAHVRSYFSWNSLVLHGFALATIWSTASVLFSA